MAKEWIPGGDGQKAPLLEGLAVAFGPPRGLRERGVNLPQ